MVRCVEAKTLIGPTRLRPLLIAAVMGVLFAMACSIMSPMRSIIDAWWVYLLALEMLWLPYTHGYPAGFLYEKIVHYLAILAAISMLSCLVFGVESKHRAVVFYTSVVSFWFSANFLALCYIIAGV